MRQKTNETEPKPKRLTLSEIVDRLLSCSADRSYVVLARNARGDTQIDVKVSTGEGGHVLTMEQAEKHATAAYNRLRALYPVREAGEPMTVGLTRNAKGETQINLEVKRDAVRLNPEALAALAVEAYDRLRARYPMQDGYTARPGSVQVDNDQRTGGEA